jgi:putative transcriptional regulator
MTHHPSTQLLTAFADGSIDACNGLTIAAHLETCCSCQQLHADIEQQAASTAFSQPAEVAVDSNFSAVEESMLAAITELPKQHLVPKLDLDMHVEVNGKRFKLPKSLHHASQYLTEWKSYGGKVYSANFDLGEDERISLLYIGKGVQVPQHTHKGTETTLVLHGQFSDENGEYGPGDFMVADASMKHQPSTADDQDCLCITVLNEPMMFTQGVARVFNMFGRGMYP